MKEWFEQALMLGITESNQGIVSGSICDCRQRHELSDHKKACLHVSFVTKPPISLAQANSRFLGGSILKFTVDVCYLHLAAHFTFQV